MFGFRVQGVGNFDGLFSFIDGPEEQTGDKSYLISVPNSNIQIDLLAGQTSLVSGEYRVVNNEETKTLFRTLNRPPVALVTDFWLSGQIEFDNYTGKNNTVVWCRRGAIRLLNEISTNRYNCTIGWLDTPRENYSLSGDNRVYDYPRVLKGRAVTKFERLYGLERIIDISDLENTGHSQGNAAFSIYTRSGLPGAFEKNSLKRKWAGQPVELATTRNAIRGEIDWIKYKSDSLPLQLVGSSQQTIWIKWEGAIYESTFSPASGYGVFDPRNNIWTNGVSRDVYNDGRWRDTQVTEVIPFFDKDAIEVIMNILTSTPSGLNGGFDLGYDLLGFDRYRFNMANIKNLRDRIRAFTAVDRFFLEYDDDNILSILEEKLLSPHLLAFTQKSGLLEITLWEDKESSFDFTDAHIIDNVIPSVSDGRDRQDDSVIVDWSPLVLPIGETRSLEIIDQFGLYSHGTGKSQISVNAETVGNYQAVLFIALSRILRVKDSIPIFTFAVDSDKARVYPGDDVTISSRNLDDSETPLYGKVISREERVREGITLYRVLVTGLYNQDRSRIGFTCQILADDGTAFTVSDGSFSGNIYSYDIEPVRGTWTVDIINQYGIILQSGLLVDPLDDVTLRYLTTPTVPTVGNYLVSNPSNVPANLVEARAGVSQWR